MLPATLDTQTFCQAGQCVQATCLIYVLMRSRCQQSLAASWRASDAGLHRMAPSDDDSHATRGGHPRPGL